MVTWTALAAVAYSRSATRRQAFLVADLVVALALMGLSAPILGTTVFANDYLALPAYWAICAPLAVAMAYGAGIGVFVDLLLSSMGERDRAFAETASLAERERLNRIVHDGVLQVLAPVEREGPGLGPRGVRLASLAREQESRLRVLLLDRTLDQPAADQVDITAVLDRHETSTVTVSAMAERVMVSSREALEIDAVVTEILANVAKHAGPGARAWVLLEHEGRELIISLRDSVLGRIRDLGGQSVVRAAPGRGVDWELRIPVE